MEAAKGERKEGGARIGAGEEQRRGKGERRED
jgi:hypothetical protein